MGVTVNQSARLRRPERVDIGAAFEEDPAVALLVIGNDAGGVPGDGADELTPDQIAEPDLRG